MVELSELHPDLLLKVIAKIGDDDACRALAQTSKQFRALADKGLSAPAQELKEKQNEVLQGSASIESYQRL